MAFEDWIRKGHPSKPGLALRSCPAERPVVVFGSLIVFSIIEVYSISIVTH